MNLTFVTKQTYTEVDAENPETYVGVWKSAGGFIRHELRADGAYIKHKGNRPAVTGRYSVEDGRISYENEQGCVFEGEFTQGRLHQAGMIFYKVV